MGNNEKSSEAWLDDNELDFYMTVNDPNMGTVEIYTCNKKLPMSFIMKVRKGAGDGQEILAAFQTIEQHQNLSLITMYECEMKKVCLCKTEGSSKQLVSYWEYYNYSLVNLIERRQSKNVSFTEDELWHLVKICCSGYTTIHTQGFWFDFDPNKLVITPEGKVKLFWGHLMPRNAHLKYLKYFVQSQFKEGYYSPQQLQCIRNKQRNLRLDFEKANIYSLGMLILYCITLTDPLLSIYKDSRIDRMQLENIILINKRRSLYSKQLWTFIESCLAENPQQRSNFNQIRTQYSAYFNEDFGMSLISDKTEAERSKGTVDVEKTRISLRRKDLTVTYSQTFI